MRYHYTPPSMAIGNKGLAVIQQRYDKATKHTWWGEIDECLRNEAYMHIAFRQYFDKRADICRNGLYPTVTIRQLMWGLKMKPIKRELWETCFDHSPF